MKVIESYGRNCPLVSNLINRVNSILMSDHFFDLRHTGRYYRLKSLVSPIVTEIKKMVIKIDD